MSLDPQLTLLVIAAVAKTKLLVDFLALSSPKISGERKLLCGYLIAFLLIFFYQAYTGDLYAAPDIRRVIAGDLLGAFEVLSGAVLLTEVQKRARRKRPAEVEETPA